MVRQMMNMHAKTIAALRLGIEVLERERRARYAAGEAAHRQGLRADTINSGGVAGVCFEWVEKDHLEFTRYARAIDRLGDLIDILSDPGADECL